MLPTMFIVSEEAATAIRTAYEQDGELSAASLVPWHHRQRRGAGVRPYHR
jgi:hypothetical protein